MRKRGRGTARLGWCRECNLPLLGGACSRCGSESEKVELTPPGDARPAFPADIRRLNDVACEDFGVRPFSTDGLVLLSKIPASDRADEVIVDGQVWTAVHFDALRLRYEMLPRWELAGRIPKTKRWVDVDHVAAEAVLDGANLMAPGVLDADPTISEGDEVMLYDGGVPMACGRARMNGCDMVGTRGFAVKVRQTGEPLPSARHAGRGWQDAVEANRQYLDALEKRAVGFIRHTAEGHPLPLTVSYSGGKDSLATLLLALESGLDFEVIFCDTGLEMPGTVEHVQDITRHYGLTLHTVSARDAFWEQFHNFGPPSVEARWCCKVAKLGPLASLIEKHYPGGTLSLIGQRGLESFSRAQKADVWRNPWVGNQIAASPIQKWSQLAVWLYIFSKGAPYNHLYESGFDRLGCFLCPSSSLADLNTVSKAFPELWGRWERTLEDYRRRHGLPTEYVKYGFWRRRRPHPVQDELKRKLGVEWELPTPDEPVLKFTELKGFSACRDGGVSAELACGTALPLADVTPMLGPLGEVRSSGGVVLIRSGHVSWQVYASGIVVVRAPEQRILRWALEAVKGQLQKALACTGCGVCVGRCPEKAIRIEGNKAKVGSGCTHCGECLAVCPLVKFNG